MQESGSKLRLRSSAACPPSVHQGLASRADRRRIASAGRKKMTSENVQRFQVQRWVIETGHELPASTSDANNRDMKEPGKESGTDSPGICFTAGIGSEAADKRRKSGMAGCQKAPFCGARNVDFSPESRPRGTGLRWALGPGLRRQGAAFKRSACRYGCCAVFGARLCTTGNNGLPPSLQVRFLHRRPDPGSAAATQATGAATRAAVRPCQAAWHRRLACAAAGHVVVHNALWEPNRDARLQCPAGLECRASALGVPESWHAAWLPG
jgi:hypothetical protein